MTCLNWKNSSVYMMMFILSDGALISVGWHQTAAYESMEFSSKRKPFAWIDLLEHLPYSVEHDHCKHPRCLLSQCWRLSKIGVWPYFILARPRIDNMYLKCGSLCIARDNTLVIEFFFPWSDALDFVTTGSAKWVIVQKLERKNAKLPPRTEAT